MPEEKHITFPVNEHGWVLLFRLFGHKTILRACKVQPNKIRKVSDETNQHRMFEIECEGGAKVKSKLFDTSDFTE